jgi:hypothetical protein
MVLWSYYDSITTVLRFNKDLLVVPVHAIDPTPGAADEPYSIKWVLGEKDRLVYV